MTRTELALQPLNSSRFFGSLFSRLVEIAVVVATTLTVSALLPRASSVASPGPSIASPTPLVQTRPDDVVGRVADGARPAVAFLIAADAVPVSFTAGGPTSETPGLGSAFIIDDEGTAITNHHVVFGHSTVRALLGDGTEVAGRVLGSDPSTDLAVVKLQTPPGRVCPLRLGDSDTVRVGQRVVVIGSPAGLTHTVTTGIVSAVGRALPAPAGRVIAGVIQTDAATFQGNSGGPMLNSHGEVVGVMTSTLGSSYGFAVPINTVKRVCPALASHGYVPRPWLGITGVGLSPLVAEKLGFPTRRGAIVDGVIPGGPADKAGIHGSEDAARQPVEVASRYPIGGDIITAVDGQSVASMDELVSYLEYEKLPGDTVTLEVMRMAEPMRVEVVLSERPAPIDASKRREPGTDDYIQVGQEQSW